MKFLMVVLFIFMSENVVASLTAKEIMSKNDEARKISSLTSHAKMNSGGGGSADHSKEFTWWRKLNDDNVHYNTLTRFHFPPEVKGEGILFLEDKDSTDIQIYLPTFKKVRRVESGQQSGSFMGSEFSYSDIATPHLADFSYKLEKEEKCPNAVAVKCWLVEGTPISDSIKERTGSSRSLEWIRQDNFMVARGEYYDLENKVWKTLEASGNKEVDTKLHKWMALNLKMLSVKTNRFTAIVFDDVKVVDKIPDSTFTVQNLQREK